MKKAKKYFLIPALTLSLAALFAIPVSAASSVGGQVGDHNTSGTLSMGSSSATAVTSTGAPSASVTVSVTYTYGVAGTSNRKTVSNGGGGVSSISSTASAIEFAPTSISATGYHSVSWNGQNWNGPTSI